MESKVNQGKTCYVLGNGVHFEGEEIEFLPYLMIRRVEKLSVFDLAALGTRGFSQWSLIQPLCYKKNNFEIVSFENNSTKGYDTLNRAWLVNVLFVIKKFTGINSVAVLDRSWNNLKEVNGEGDVRATLCDYHVNMLILSGLAKNNLCEEDIHWISTYFEIANNLASRYEKFRYILVVLNSWRYCVDKISAIATIWTAIESVVNVSSEITYRLSLNISSLLTERGEERINKFKKVKSLYGLRSKVVHGSGIKESDLISALVDSFNLLVELTNYMIENDKMIEDADFTNAIFR